MKQILIFEGIASSGKSTLINKLREELKTSQTTAVFPENETLIPLVENRNPQVALSYIQKYLTEKIFPTKEDVLLVDRLHLTHAFRTNSDLEFFRPIENELSARFRVLVIMLTVDPIHIGERLTQTLSFRGNWGKGKQGTLKERVAYYLNQQIYFDNLCRQTILPHIKVDTSDKNWERCLSEIKNASE